MSVSAYKIEHSRGENLGREREPSPDDRSSRSFLDCAIRPQTRVQPVWVSAISRLRRMTCAIGPLKSRWAYAARARPYTLPHTSKERNVVSRPNAHPCCVDGRLQPKMHGQRVGSPTQEMPLENGYVDSLRKQLSGLPSFVTSDALIRKTRAEHKLRNPVLFPHTASRPWRTM